MTNDPAENPFPFHLSVSVTPLPQVSMMAELDQEGKRAQKNCFRQQSGSQGRVSQRTGEFFA